MRRDIKDVDGGEIVVATEGVEFDLRLDDRAPAFGVIIYPHRDAILADVETLDELIAALQEAREEIVGRETTPGAPPAFSIADSSAVPG